MDTGARLRWVAKNKARRDTTCPVGGLVAQAVRASSRTDGAVLALLCERLGEVVDDEFRMHCRAVAVRNGNFIVSVDAPSMVSLMKTCWRARLQAAIGLLAPRSRVRDVIFEFGSSGLMFTRAANRAPTPLDETPNEVETGTIYG